VRGWANSRNSGDLKKTNVESRREIKGVLKQLTRENSLGINSKGRSKALDAGEGQRKERLKTGAHQYQTTVKAPLGGPIWWKEKGAGRAGRTTLEKLVERLNWGISSRHCSTRRNGEGGLHAGDNQSHATHRGGGAQGGAGDSKLSQVRLQKKDENLDLVGMQGRRRAETPVIRRNK